ncbi:MAG: uroporphyrinogen-III synthase [Brevundimonas sp.]|uniref:uroporphyrinogen-III synthase n=1 Tax=Brevundimonas sp. TaxID=1871086 RepID=UPI0039191CFC
MSAPPGRIWITRTLPGARATARRIRAMGFAPLVSPVLKVVARKALPALRGPLAFTSSNAVRALARSDVDHEARVYCVGDATARAARRAGFRDVKSAGGDVEALAALIAREASGGAITHVAGLDRAGDLAGLLGASGIAVNLVEAYETRRAVPKAGLKALRSGALGAVLVHSPRGAEALVDALHRHAISASAQDLPVIAISQAAAAPLRAAGMGAILVSDSPDDAGVCETLGKAASRV